MPKPTTALTRQTAAHIARLLTGEPSAEKLNRTLRHLAKWRAEMVANTVAKRSGTKVLSGPFQGMDYAVRAAEGSRAARLLGAYEATLAPVIERIIASAPELVVDIGSAEGYYAVGLARRLPQARILARDASPGAQKLCAALARLNGVEAQVEIGGLFGHDDFAICEGRRAVVICDIEGAEDALLDPQAAPGLRHADILVEVHETRVKGLADRLASRFAATHRITRLGRRLDDSGFPAWMEEFSDMDRLIALWEWRSGPTPWLWMEKA